MAQPAQITTRRSAGVVAMALPLLAILVLAGLGAAASLRDGARAERVRGLAPFTGALTTVVHELQRERSLSAEESDGPVLAGARRTVDVAAARYRDAAVRVEISDRDPRLHQRLDTGLAQLAGLTTLRAAIDSPAGADQAETTFRRYTEIIGGLLSVDGEIGLSEAGEDAELVRAVTAATAFSRAKELAARERDAAVQAATGRPLDQTERTRLAFLGGRQAALLDQFTALASPGQAASYTSAFTTDDSERVTDLRRAALEAGPGQGAAPDLTGWSDATTSRVERMREVELALTAEVARLAGLTDQAADRRALAYAAAFLLAASTLVVLLVLAPGRRRRARAERVGPADPVGAAGGWARREGWARRARRNSSLRCSAPRRGSVAQPRRAVCRLSTAPAPTAPAPSAPAPTAPALAPTALAPMAPMRSAPPSRPTPSTLPRPFPPRRSRRTGRGWPTSPGGARTWSTSSSSCWTRPGGTRATRSCLGGCSSSTDWRCGRGATPTT